MNPKILGWAHYYRYVVSSKTFSKVDHCIHQELDRWMRKRHARKGVRWMKAKYFRNRGLYRWQFFTKVKKRGKPFILDLAKASRIHIQRYVKIVGEAHPYHPDYKEYFIQRKLKKKATRQIIPLLSPIPDGHQPVF